MAVSTCQKGPAATGWGPVVGDGSALERIGKERARLEPMARQYHKVARLENDLAEARAALNDPELRELAEAEVAELEPQLEQEYSALRELLVPRDSDADLLARFEPAPYAESFVTVSLGSWLSNTVALRAT